MLADVYLHSLFTLIAGVDYLIRVKLPAMYKIGDIAVAAIQILEMRKLDRPVL